MQNPRGHPAGLGHALRAVLLAHLWSEDLAMSLDPTLTRTLGIEYRLVPKEGLRRLALRYTVGGQKYGEGNWKRGLRNQGFIEERKNHLVEHLFEYLERGNKNDDNLAAIAWGCFCLMEAEKVALEDADDAKVLGITE